MTKDDFFAGISMPINQELMRVFRDVEFVEQLGSGMLRIMEVYKPENFEFGDNYIRFKVPFYKYNDTLNDPIKNHKLTERQLLIVDIIKNSVVSDPINDPINDISSRLLIAKKLKVSEATVKRDIASLVKLGIIKRFGSNKTGHWEVVTLY